MSEPNGQAPRKQKSIQADRDAQIEALQKEQAAFRRAIDRLLMHLAWNGIKIPAEKIWAP